MSTTRITVSLSHAYYYREEFVSELSVKYGRKKQNEPKRLITVKKLETDSVPEQNLVDVGKNTNTSPPSLTTTA